MTFLSMPKVPRPLVFWEHRVYPGTLDQLARVRAELATDLAGFDEDLVETVRLCASELFANSVKYTDSGGRDGEVLRALSMPDARTLRFSVSDCGGGGGVPAVPEERTEDEWSWPEGQRGLLLVENLSRRWGHFRLEPWADLGTHVWAVFDVEAGAAPPDPRPHVFTGAAG
ncbi:anti-sigma regulatory factor (Ser/Thr protein kinase) [Nocardiopsis arvandica]|uniref:Anti-sigma regulatory factor (Ser/Thr protein kinase) n=1 Tax=Nocardiopsis sinuspersici TaxID=501010 RepID=A0A7Y9XCW1_9ACTN|nr:ATP-binding protein [Nocardiopsis sinuspersici]NYH52420.1 anti-sigma regulatory factor (Ser/Thr protein kinase) [Nocardiopsis sinuspersici]